LVKELVDLLQGKIRVESRVGAGTAFYMNLPVKEQFGEAVAEDGRPESLFVLASDFLLSERTEVKKPENEPKIKSGENERILLIAEDNDDLRAYIRSVFDDAYRVIEAVDGKEGFGLAIKYIPDIVISDLMMPEMDGFELCQALKTNEKTSHIPVVMLTAKATTQDRIEGFETGADDYLVKPFNATEIKARVRNLIAIREMLKKLYTQSMIEGGVVLPENGSSEEPFIRKVQATLEREFSNSSFGVEQLAQEMNMSSSQLLRKLKALTSLTTVEFIREYRLQKAAKLLAQKSATVSEIAYLTGFESLPYFTKMFQQKYKTLPSEY
jgi:DNA-binding response OmpR family regulator